MTMSPAIFNIFHIIGHYLGKHAFGAGNFIHQGGCGWLYLVPSASANKQKGHVD